MTRSCPKEVHNNLVSEPIVMGDRVDLASKLDKFMEHITLCIKSLQEKPNTGEEKVKRIDNTSSGSGSVENKISSHIGVSLNRMTSSSSKSTGTTIAYVVSSNKSSTAEEKAEVKVDANEEKEMDEQSRKATVSIKEVAEEPSKQFAETEQKKKDKGLQDYSDESYLFHTKRLFWVDVTAKETKEDILMGHIENASTEDRSSSTIQKVEKLSEMNAATPVGSGSTENFDSEGLPPSLGMEVWKTRGSQVPVENGEHVPSVGYPRFELEDKLKVEMGSNDVDISMGLQDIKALFPPDHNPFYAGFGNRHTDELSYLRVGIPRGKIFTINPKGQVVVNRRVDTKSYTSLHTIVHDMFPPTTLHEQEDYNSWNFWRLPPPDVGM